MIAILNMLCGGMFLVEYPKLIRLCFQRVLLMRSKDPIGLFMDLFLILFFSSHLPKPYISPCEVSNHVSLFSRHFVLRFSCKIIDILIYGL